MGNINIKHLIERENYIHKVEIMSNEELVNELINKSTMEAYWDSEFITDMREIIKDELLIRLNKEI